MRALANEFGVVLDYVDGTGRRHDADPDVVIAVLRALDDTNAEVLRSPADAARALRRRIRTGLDRMCEPVTVVEEGHAGAVELVLAPGDATIDCWLESEDGESVEWRIRRDDLAATSTERVEGREVRRVGVPLRGVLAPGYHRFTARVGGKTCTSTVVVAPARGARGRYGDDWRAFGVMAPLFSLHSRRHDAPGDLRDLDELARFAATRQAAVVATLPLLAGFGPSPFDASPYLPVSRQFWHERWIDVERVPELARSPITQLRLGSDRLATRRDDDGSDVDGAAALAWKRARLEELAAVVGGAAGREAGLRAFVHRRPEVLEYARFRAAGERFGNDWRQWPGPARGGLLRWNDVDPVMERYHTYVQWIADEQMQELASRFTQRGQTLALDLPVGVHPMGYDVWRHRGQYAPGMAVGAPPDPLAERGQVWGFPPPRPESWRADGFQQFRAALAFHLRVAGLLRIDHVMGLQRLFWIPDGADPAAGVYVTMPLRELLAVVAVEAARHGADVVGEDLGTVDPELRDEMDRVRLRRMYVAQFGIHAHDDDAPLESPPPASVASFATHDTATFSGWWSGADLDERVALGLADAAEHTMMQERRADQRAALCRAVLPGADPGTVDPAAVLQAVHAALAASDAALVMVQLDDLLAETAAVNVPGTTDQRANWQTRARLGIDELAHDAGVDAVLAPMQAARGDRAVHAGPALDGAPQTVVGVSRLGDADLHLFNEGRHFRLYERLGATPTTVGGVHGCAFAVWAPNAERVAVIGDFNGWDGTRHPLMPRGNSGIWEGFVPGAGAGARYKYRMRTRHGHEIDKADPYARASEEPPRTASIVWTDGHTWGDDDWMRTRPERQALGAPMSIYELHLGSWRRIPEDGNRSLTYREIAPRLVEYVQRLGFTHVELLPVMEHPFYGSWGYQTTGYFAPTSRYGTPDDFAAFVDTLHQAGIGVLLDWVPSHFPADAFALAEFDGTHLYEHADPRQRVHPDWDSWIFNYGRNEVRSFLVSSACFWLDRFHIDGLRVDAVASMLYLDYSRAEGEWIPNRFGGKENLEAISLLQECNAEVYRSFPGIVTIAEESTAWPGVSKPVHAGGLGFGHKWDMGWMHDTLSYLRRDPIHRGWHHDELSFRAVYASTEHFVLPLSHDEVVHGKGALVQQMAGDEWQRFANLRLLYGQQFTTPGKKLLFMGNEFAQPHEWHHDGSLDWHVLDDPRHAGVAAWVAHLNALYGAQRALHCDDVDDGGFEWIEWNDRANSVLSWVRRAPDGDLLAIVANFTPVPRGEYRIGLPRGGRWRVVANSDDVAFGGSGYPVRAEIKAEKHWWHSRPESASIALPPLALLVLRPA